jgi:hypothetical protein
MEELAIELKLLVVEQAWSLRELGALRLSCRVCRDAVDSGLEGWMREHRVGTPSNSFSAGELGLAMRLITRQRVGRTAVAQGVLSLTCDVSAEGEVRWFLTKESGRVPVCDKAAECGCDGKELGVVPVRGYVVLQSWPSDCLSSVVRFAALRVETVRRLVERVLPAALAVFARSGSWCGATERVLRAMSLGGWRAALEKCTCCASRTFVCAVCEPPDWESEDSEWVTMNIFKRRFPYGREDWFSGVSDAVLEVDRSGQLWLTCAQHRPQ